MKSLRVELTTLDTVWIRLRYWLNTGRSETRELRLADIQSLIDRGELHYYTTRPNLVSVGQQLFDWLDGNGRWLSREIQNCTPPGLVLAIDTGAALAHLPWEVLHDGKEFLAERLGTPIVPVRWLSNLPVDTVEPQARPLKVLFMATAPEDRQPVLDFEYEEAEILRFMNEEEVPLTLRVEESGCIKEMGKLWRKYSSGTFDIFHLTGHAYFREGCPFFITETETGTQRDVTAEAIFQEFGGRLPRLIFLSGCRTAQADEQGTVASMAESLVKLGVPAVLGWGQSVNDASATVAAARLYQRLATGCSLTEALGDTYRYLRREEVPGWHLLRLYALDATWSPLVNPPGDYIPPPETVQDHFLDNENRIRVATPDQFVGRRRLLQRCLRQLRQRDCIGLMLHGLGGNGKSTLAARLLERLPEYQPLVVYRQLDIETVMGALEQQCLSEEGHAILNGSLPTMQKLAKLLKDGLNDTKQKFCFVLDDFEANLEANNSGEQKLKVEVVDALNGLLNAILQSGKPHRVVFTSRYKFALPQQDQRIKREFVQALDKAELTKKYTRLKAFQTGSKVASALQARAKEVADGNPRLLEWLDLVLQDKTTDKDQILERMAAKEVEFRESILAETLLSQQQQSLHRMLGRLLVYRLPVPAAAVKAVCEDISDLVYQRQRAVALSLLELTPLKDTYDYRVPRVLQPLLPDIVTAEIEHMAGTVLYQLWWEEAGPSNEGEWTRAIEEKCLEIHRLALAAGMLNVATKLNSDITNHWREQGRYRQVEELCNKTLELIDDSLAYHNLAYVERALGKTEAALKHYQRALTLYESNGNSKGKATALHEMAYIYRRQGQVEKGMTLYKESLVLREAVCDVKGKAATLHEIANIYRQQGQIERGMRLYEKSLALKETIGDVKGKATTLHEIAYVHRQQGNAERAMEFHQESLLLREIVRDFQGKADTLHQMACIHQQKGQIEKAMALHHESLALKDIIGDVQGKAATLHAMAGIHRQKGQMEEAMALYQESLSVKETIGDIKGKAATLDSIASIRRQQGQVEEAMALYQESLLLKETVNNVHGKANTLHAMASIYQQQGQLEYAIALYQESLSIKESIDNIQGKAATLVALASLVKLQGDIERSIQFNLQAAQSLERIGAYGDLAAVLDDLSDTDTTQQNIYLAQSVWLSLVIKKTLDSLISRLSTLFERVPGNDDLRLLLATAAHVYCLNQGDGQPQLKLLQQQSFKMLSATASIFELTDQVELQALIVNKQLNEPRILIPRLMTQLEAIVGDHWVFDRARVQQLCRP